MTWPKIEKLKKEDKKEKSPRIMPIRYEGDNRDIDILDTFLSENHDK